MSKTYTLKIPRPQYDRLGAAELIKDDTFFKKFIPATDEKDFSISEDQRKSFAKYAKSNKGQANKYWITQMFLPKNIKQYEV